MDLGINAANAEHLEALVLDTLPEDTRAVLRVPEPSTTPPFSPTISGVSSLEYTDLDSDGETEEIPDWD